MNNTPKNPTPLLIMLAAVGFIAGYGCGILVGELGGRETIKRTAAKLGLAYWDADPQTGAPVFHWKKD